MAATLIFSDFFWNLGTAPADGSAAHKKVGPKSFSVLVRTDVGCLRGSFIIPPMKTKNVNSQLELNLLRPEPYPSLLFACFVYFAVLSPPYSQRQNFLRSSISDLLLAFFVTARVT